MQLKEFKIHCSQNYQIMGKTGLTDKQEERRQELITRSLESMRGKAKPLTKNMKIELDKLDSIVQNPELPKTCTSYLEQWVKEQIYGTKKEIKSKYLTKGIDVEDLAIEYYAEQKDLGFVLKNTDYFENDFIKGTPDLLLPDEVIEFKSSWDCFTFPLFEDQIDPKYYAQVQGYMAITGRKKGKLVYTLQNTPDELQWDEPVDYSELNPKFRIKEYDIPYDSSFIDSVENRVIECREYISHLTKNL